MKKKPKKLSFRASLNKIMKIILKTVLAIFVVIVLIGLVNFGVDYYNYNLKLTDLAEIPSDNGSYSVMIQQVGEPKGAFGDFDVRVTVKADGEILHEFKSEIANDGKMLDWHNWQVEWNEETVTVILDGEEQEEEIFTIELQ